jgi:hypothetical protein
VCSAAGFRNQSVFNTTLLQAEISAGTSIYCSLPAVWFGFEKYCCLLRRKRNGNRKFARLTNIELYKTGAGIYLAVVHNVNKARGEDFGFDGFCFLYFLLQAVLA